jgi:plastocyanin
MRRAISGLAGLLLFIMIPSTPSEAATSTIATGSGNTFSALSYSIDQGDSVVFSNTDGQRHNVKSTSLFEGDFLFGTSTVQPGSSGPVEGVEFLATGSYPFFCAFHPGMEASLIVGPGGSPLERPRVSTRILTYRKRFLVRKGYLRIELTSAVSVPSLSLRVVRASRELAEVSADLTANTARVIEVRLPASFRRRLASMKVVRIGIRGSVPYGTFESAERNFR